MAAKLVITATVPDAAVRALMQAIRDFDSAHPDCHFQIAANAPEMTTEEMCAALDVTPPFPFRDVLARFKP